MQQQNQIRPNPQQIIQAQFNLQQQQQQNQQNLVQQVKKN